MNAFRPDSEMDDPDLFTGRRGQIVDLTDSMLSAGSCPMILGDRGLGKSSLAKQLRLIAMGDRALLERYDASDNIISVDDSYIALYIGCSDAVRNTTDLLRRLTDGVASVASRKASPREYQLVDRTSQAHLSLKFFSLDRTKKWQPATWAPRRTDSVADYEQALIDATTRLSDIYESRVLLIVDELDRVRDKQGLASFIKVATAPVLKFVLVGIAQNVADLLSDHRSIERVVMPTHVPPMSRDELQAIVDRAMHRLRTEGVSLRFHADTANKLAGIASGFPWFVHVLGQASVVAAFRKRDKEVTDAHLTTAIRSLTGNRFAQQFSDQYQHVVRESLNREVALRAFAKWNDRDIPTSEVYPVIRALGIANPSEYRRQLCAESSGVLTPFRGKGMVRFSNEMFKIYVRLRASIFQDVDKRVDTAWASRHQESSD